MLDYVETVLATQDLQTLWNYHVNQMSEFGFTRLLYGFTDAGSKEPFGDPMDALVLSSHSEAYNRAFIGEGLYRQSPMIRWASKNSGGCSWAWVEQEARAGRLSADELEVRALNRRFDLVAGYTISFPSSSARLRGAIALGAKPGLSQREVDEVWMHHGRTISAMNGVAHLRLSTLPHAGARRPLTARQRQVLELVADGETVAGVARRLDLSAGTIEKHLRLARSALNVETTAAALHKAGWQNQIFLLDR